MNILLVHGLGRSPGSLFSLAARLRRAGHRTTFFAYSPLFESLERIRQRLVEKLQTLGRLHTPIGAVGHSFGGILLRMALAELPQLSVHRLVMLGTPNRSAEAARFASRWRLFRRLTRDCGRLLTDPKRCDSLPIPSAPYTLIAGAAGPRARWLPLGDVPNDGLVAVDEVRIRDSDEVLLFPVWHSVMMNIPDVQEAVVEAMMS